MSAFEQYIDIPIMTATDIVVARKRARDMASRLGFGAADQTRLATAVSELTRNVITYAGTGSCRIEDLSSEHRKEVRIVVEDQGPGIANIELAMQDGYSTSGGLGAGLPGTRRLADSFSIESRPGMTRITIGLQTGRYT